MFEYNGIRTSWIDGYINKYAVTDTGIVLSYAQNNVREMSGSKRSNRYHEVIFRMNNKIKSFSVHRLVALAFIENPDNLPQVDHIDHNKMNNDVSNLRWITNKDNTHHYYKTKNGDDWSPVKRYVMSADEKEAVSSLREKQKSERLALKRSQMKYGSVNELVKQTGKPIVVNGIEFMSAGSASLYTS